VDAPDPVTPLNRAAFLTRLEHLNIDASEADLRWWEWEGYLPRPERRWDPEVRARRAYYPAAAMAAVFALRELQAEGYHLADMAPTLRDAAERAARSLHETLPRLRPEDLADEVTEDDIVDTLVLVAGMDAVSNALLGGEIWPRLLRLARLDNRYRQAVRPDTYQPITRVDVVFTDSTGKEKHYWRTVPPQATSLGNDGK